MNCFVRRWLSLGRHGVHGGQVDQASGCDALERALPARSGRRGRRRRQGLRVDAAVPARGEDRGWSWHEIDAAVDGVLRVRDSARQGLGVPATSVSVDARENIHSNITYSLYHNCQTAGVHENKQYVGLAM